MATPTKITLASRGSPLALTQTRWIQARCREALPEWTFDIRIIQTTGDKLQKASMSQGNLPKGLFTKELEQALIGEEADLAVHSLKDLPTVLPDGLTLGAVSEREDARDVLVVRKGALQEASSTEPESILDRLPEGIIIATSSTRREAQLLERRPDLRTIPIRGNVGTRLKKLADAGAASAKDAMTGTLLAAAGMRRLQIQWNADGDLTGEGVPEGLQAFPLPYTDMLPCVGQAALGIEVRDQDNRMAPVCQALNDAMTWNCMTAERAFLQAMGGGCQLAVAAYARPDQDQLLMEAVSYLGSEPQRASARAEPERAEQLGLDLATTLKPERQGT